MKRYTVSMALLSALLLLADAATAQIDPLDGSNYARSIAQWQKEWEAKLKGPNGWRALASSGSDQHWLGTDNDIQLAEEAAPPKLGEFLLEGEVLTFQAEPGMAVFSEGVPVAQLRSVHDQAGEPSRLTHGTFGWQLTRRMERLGVHLRDYEHP